jgi:putative DNA primase/helicase
MFEFEDDNLLTTEVESLMIRNNLDCGRAAKYVYMMARKNKINSFKEVLDNTIWDGKSRIDEFCRTINVNPVYEDLRNLYIKKWLQQLIYLSHVTTEDRKVGRYILVFQSNQEMGKTTWVRSLLPVKLKNYISEGLHLDFNNSMSIKACITNLIVELGELQNSFKKTDQDEFKAFFGRTKDVLNEKFVPFPVTYMRTTSFIGSINDEEFLRDRTGSTRFLVIPTKNLNGYHDIDMLQLFKEIRENTDYVNFELNDDEKEHNKMFEVPDILEEGFLDHYDIEADKDICDYYSAMQVLEQLGYRRQDINNARRMDIGRIMRKYKCHRNSKTKKWLLKLKEERS